MPECALPEEYIDQNLDQHCLEDTGPCGVLPTLVGGHRVLRYRVLCSLVVRETRLLEPVSPRMHASPQTL